MDARDVARLVVDLLMAGRGGGFTAAGPQTDFAGLIATCAEAAGAEVELVPASPAPGVPLARAREVWDTLHRTPAAEMGELNFLDAGLRFTGFAEGGGPTPTTLSIRAVKP